MKQIMQDHSYPSDTDARSPASKRPRTQTRNACTKCRQRRVKCSGNVPCRRCQEIGESETCLVPTRTARATTSRILELERQVQLLTATIEAARSDTSPPSTASVMVGCRDDTKVEPALFLSQGGSSAAAPAKRQSAPDAWSDDEKPEPNGGYPDKGASTSLFVTQRVPRVTFLGPARTRQVLQLYAEQTQPIHPILAWSTFLEDYEKYEPLLPFVPNRVWLATLQVVVAHAMQTISPNVGVDVQPSTFFAEALHILDLPALLATTTPALVQCLLLMTAFAQTLNEPDLIISLLGLAIQKCKALGYTSRSPLDVPSRLARLCWSGCISRDFYVSVALGKAPFLNEQDCRTELLPLTKEEDALLRQPNARPHPLAFFNEGIKLHHIVFRALHGIYPHIGSESFNIALLQELDECLLTWHQQLPSFLQPDQQTTATKEATYIQARFWYSRNLVHRSALCHLLSMKAISSAGGISLEVLVACAKVAAEAGLQLIDRLCPVIAETTTAWWINLIGLYSACLTLILATRLDSKNVLSSKISPERSEAALHTALDAFDRFSLSASSRLSAASRTSEYCAADIKRLREKVPALSRTNAGRMPNSGLLPPAATEPWYFAGYDWSRLFDVSAVAQDDIVLEPSGLENTNFDFSRLRDHPGLPTFNQNHEELLHWLEPQ